MTYVVLISHNESFLHYMNYYVSTYSQNSNEEIATFSHQTFDHLKEVMRSNEVGLVFFDIEDARRESMLKSMKNSFTDIVCVGVGRCHFVADQSRLFTMGMDDYLSIPMSHELFKIRMKSQLGKVQAKAQKKKQSTSVATSDDESLFEHEDREDFEEILHELHLQILLMGKSEIDESDVYKMTALLGRIQSRFMYLVATFALVGPLHELCEAIEDNVQTFIEQSSDLHTIALSFVNDIIQWKKAVLYDKSQKADFLNASIIANAAMFKSLVDRSTADEKAELDSIFDF